MIIYENGTLKLCFARVPKLAKEFKIASNNWLAYKTHEGQFMAIEETGNGEVIGKLSEITNEEAKSLLKDCGTLFAIITELGILWEEVENYVLIKL